MECQLTAFASIAEDLHLARDESSYCLGGTEHAGRSVSGTREFVTQLSEAGRPGPALWRVSAELERRRVDERALAANSMSGCDTCS